MLYEFKIFVKEILKTTNEIVNELKKTNALLRRLLKEKGGN